MANSAGKLVSYWAECERGLSGFDRSTLTRDFSAPRNRTEMVRYFSESAQPCVQFFFSWLLCKVALNALSGGFSGSRRMRK